MDNTSSLLFPSSLIFEKPTFEDCIRQSLIDVLADPPPEDELIQVFKNGLVELTKSHQIETDELIMKLLININSVFANGKLGEEKKNLIVELFIQFCNNNISNKFLLNFVLLGISLGQIDYFYDDIQQNLIQLDIIHSLSSSEYINFHENSISRDLTIFFIINAVLSRPLKQEIIQPLLEQILKICKENNAFNNKLFVSLLYKVVEEDLCDQIPNDFINEAIKLVPNFIIHFIDVMNEDTFKSNLNALISKIKPLFSSPQNNQSDTNSSVEDDFKITLLTFLKKCYSYHIMNFNINELLEFLDPQDIANENLWPFIEEFNFTFGKKFSSKLVNNDIISSNPIFFLKSLINPLLVIDVKDYINYLKSYEGTLKLYDNLFKLTNPVNSSFKDIDFWKRYISLNPSESNLNISTDCFFENYKENIDDLINVVYDLLEDNGIQSESTCRFIRFLTKKFNSNIINAFERSPRLHNIFSPEFVLNDQEDTNYSPYPYFFWGIFSRIEPLLDYADKHFVLVGIAYILLNNSLSSIPELELFVYDQDEQSQAIIMDFIERYFGQKSKSYDINSIFSYYTNNDCAFSLISSVIIFSIIFHKKNNIHFYNVESSSLPFFLISLLIVERMNLSRKKIIDAQIAFSHICENQFFFNIFDNNEQISSFNIFLINHLIDFISRNASEFFYDNKIINTKEILFQLCTDDNKLEVLFSQKRFNLSLLSILISYISFQNANFELIYPAFLRLSKFIYENAYELFFIENLRNIKFINKVYDISNYLNQLKNCDGEISINLNYIILVNRLIEGHNEFYKININDIYKILDEELGSDNDNIQKLQEIVNFIIKANEVNSKTENQANNQIINNYNFDFIKYLLNEKSSNQFIQILLNDTRLFILMQLNANDSKFNKYEIFFNLYKRLDIQHKEVIPLLCSLFLFNHDLLIDYYRLQFENFYENFTSSAYVILTNFLYEFKTNPIELCTAMNESYIRIDKYRILIRRANPYPLRPIPEIFSEMLTKIFTEIFIHDSNKVESDIFKNLLLFYFLSAKLPVLFQDFNPLIILKYILNNFDLSYYYHDPPNSKEDIFNYFSNSRKSIISLMFLVNTCSIPKFMDILLKTILAELKNIADEIPNENKVLNNFCDSRLTLLMILMLSFLSTPTVQFITVALMIKYNWNKIALFLLHNSTFQHSKNLILNVTQIYLHLININIKSNIEIINEIINIENPFEICYAGNLIVNSISTGYISKFYKIINRKLQCIYTQCEHTNNISKDAIDLEELFDSIFALNRKVDLNEPPSEYFEKFMKTLDETVPEPLYKAPQLPKEINEIAFQNLPLYQQSLVLDNLIQSFNSTRQSLSKMKSFLFHQNLWVSSYIENPSKFLLFPEHYLALYNIFNSFQTIHKNENSISASDLLLEQFYHPDLISFLFTESVLNAKNHIQNSIISFNILKEFSCNIISLEAIADLLIKNLSSIPNLTILKIMEDLILNSAKTQLNANDFSQIVTKISIPIIDYIGIWIEKGEFQNSINGISCFIKLLDNINIENEQSYAFSKIIQHLILILFNSQGKIAYTTLDLLSKLSKDKIENIGNYIGISFDIFLKTFSTQNFEMLQLYLKSFPFLLHSRKTQLLEFLRSLFKEFHNRNLPIIGTLFDNLCPPHNVSGSIQVDSGNRQPNEQDLSSSLPASQHSDPHEIFCIPQNLKIQNPEFWSIVEENKVLITQLIDERNSRLNKEFKFLTLFPDALLLQPRMKLFRTLQNRKIKPNSVRIEVNRNSLLEDSLRKFTSDSEAIWYTFRIKFVGERGIDAGGLTREWFTSLVKEIFNPNYALFSPSSNGRSNRPNPASYVNPSHMIYFKFAGKIIARALIEGVPVSAHFSRSFLKQILGLEKSISLRDLEDTDQELYRSFIWILNNDVDPLEMTFTADYDNLGKHMLIEIKPDGANIAVNNENKKEYIQQMIRHRLVTSTERQTAAFLEGFYSLIPREEIRMFKPDELNLLICGIPEIDIEDLRANICYMHPYNSMHKTIVFFFNVISRWSMENKAKLLMFITGTSQVPIGGFKALHDSGSPISIEYGGKSDRLPVAHTCTNTLDLPLYESEEELERKLTYAIQECNGFGIA